MDDQAVATLAELQIRLQTLKLMPRTGWLQRGLDNVESVAEHSFGVAILALIVSDQLPELDRERLLATALIHDMAEALIGDLPASARRLLGADVKQEAERKALLELLHGLPQAERYLALWEDYNRGATPEARLVKALDRLEMLGQALIYERAGARTLNEFWEDRNGWFDEFPPVRAMAERLYAEHDRHSGC